MAKQVSATISTNWISYMAELTSEGINATKESFFRTRSRFNKPNFKFKFSRNMMFIVLGLIIIAGVVLIAATGAGSPNTQANSDKPNAPVINDSVVINREFSFPIKDAEGKELSKIKYLIESASLQDEILVKGERARAVKGRTFLILSLKITNTYKQGIQINSRDYIRLIVDGKRDELTAADIHNDPVEVQAISTKSTKIGFPINESFQSLEIQVGEINGKKQDVKIDFTK